MICQRESENESNHTDAIFCAVCRKFVIVYGRKDFKGSVDDLQAVLYDHFKVYLRIQPPTEDTLIQHVLRAFMQIIITKSSSQSQHNIPDQTEYGRHVTNNRLIPSIMLKLANPT